MSLRIVHLFFIAASALLAAFIGIRAFVLFAGAPAPRLLGIGIAAFLCGGGLLAYGIRFYGASKNLGRHVP